jgi:argonaute-like protein implicated in RNA metabolism and viral defense
VIYDEELKGIRNFIKSITSRYSIVKYAVLSVKKDVPYRVYACKDNNISYPNAGSYAVLEERYGLLDSSGYPLIKNRLVKPLFIELIEAKPEEWYSIYDALQESHELSFMHWATLTQKTKYPAPIKYADDLSLLASKKHHHCWSFTIALMAFP